VKQVGIAGLVAVAYTHLHSSSASCGFLSAKAMQAPAPSPKPHCPLMLQVGSGLYPLRKHGQP